MKVEQWKLSDVEPELLNRAGHRVDGRVVKAGIVFVGFPRENHEKTLAGHLRLGARCGTGWQATAPSMAFL